MFQTPFEMVVRMDLLKALGYPKIPENEKNGSISLLKQRKRFLLLTEDDGWLLHALSGTLGCCAVTCDEQNWPVSVSGGGKMVCSIVTTIPLILF